jgi:hypothetical protein
MAINELRWSGVWYRSLPAVALAAERAVHASRFRSVKTEFVMEWMGQDRRYGWYDAEAVHDTRRYGFPVRAMLTVQSDDRFQGEIRIIADSNRDDDEPPAVRLSARGIAGASVKAAFEAALNTLSDEALFTATEYDVLEIKAAARAARPLRGSGLIPAAVGRTAAKNVLGAIEAHPALVALIGIVVGVAVAFFAK